MKFKQIKKQCAHFIINIATSGKYRGKREFGMSEYLIKYVLMNFICIFGGAVLLGFIFVRFGEGKYGTVAACSVMFLIAVLTITLLRSKKVAQIVPASILMFFYALLCVMVTWLGEAYGSNYLFIYMYPPLTIMMLGMRFGVVFSLILPGLVFTQMMVPGFSRYSYPVTVPIHMLVTYSLVFFVVVVGEVTRKTKDRLIEIQNRRLQELKEEADAANRTKSNFLASMSHEIRTPMNAITGMAELALRRELSDEVRSYVQDIKQAGNNLISIINDILDFSKIEAGKLEIIPVKYLFSSLINDTVNIIRLRLAEKPIRFFTNIDGNIPNSLTGDEVRIRQILLNLLSNAAKYTEKGYVSLTIAADKRADKQIWLKITVADTGKGITPENQTKLFGDFVQVDTRKNRGIEGTGLGLAITRRICRIMGGDITVESEYGKGSSFTALIPQGIDSDVPFAAVNEPEKKKVLVYEGRVGYAKSVCWSLENMNVPYTMVTNLDDFTAALKREEWFFVFSGYGLYERIKPVMQSAAFPNGRKPPLALMVELGDEPYIPHVRFISLPVQSLSIANTLNGKADIHYEGTGTGSTVRFIFPGARLLVVDDIATNLKVAEGLLAPYQAAVDTCLNGLQAIETVKRHNYDIVFMDHMMPEMDGIEAVAAIRALEGERFKTIPIIALTANAVSGMREMFIEKGFNDFLAKPIDISKLDEILDCWIPKEKREQGIPQSPVSGPRSLFPAIPGVDTVKGIALTGGTLDAYRQVLALFRKDAEDRLPLLQAVPETDALSAFATQVHALKSASASIGAAEVSKEAAELEAAGKAVNLDFIREHLNSFAGHLAELTENIRTALEKETTAALNKNAEADGSSLPVIARLLRELETALKSQDASVIDRTLEELNAQPLNAKMIDSLGEISDDVLMAEFDKAEESIRLLLEDMA